jgi:hypothetical protein
MTMIKTISLSVLLVLLGVVAGGIFINQITEHPDRINHYYHCDVTDSYKFCEKVSSTNITCTFYIDMKEQYGNKTSEQCKGVGWIFYNITNNINIDIINNKNNNNGMEVCSINGCVKK